ncbi:MAG: hypothetical protein ACREV2_15015 [Burkholderiales bacterium]
MATIVDPTIGGLESARTSRREIRRKRLLPLKTRKSISLSDLFKRIPKEPPLRVFVWAALHIVPSSVHARNAWGVSGKPAYLLGTLTAAKIAIEQNVAEISVIEFGVAGGRGLLVLQSEAEAVERQTGVKVNVYGFDTGSIGTPKLIGDYRDHPDHCQPGDFPMDEDLLRSQLSERTTLILGDVAETVEGFFDDYNAAPVGFVSFDIDGYSGVRDALKIFTLPSKRMLRQVPIFMPNENIYNHKFAGAMLAVEEFNQQSSGVKIDRWYGVKIGNAFPERNYFEQMYIAHDLDTISRR